MKHCCWCIKVKTGALIIGAMQLISLVSRAMTQFNLMTFALKIFTVGCFLMMLYKDNEINRMMYFVSYCIEIAILYSIEFYMIYLAYSSDVAETICKKI